MSYYRDRQGRPLELMQWAALLDDREYRTVALTVVGDVKISTVWLGVEHPFGMYFETMTFRGDGDGEQYRYRTEAEAIAGHGQVVAQVRQLQAGEQ